MSLIEQLNDELKEAMKNKDSEKLSMLRMLKSSIHNREIEKGSPMEDGDVLEIIGKEAKKRKESIKAFEDGGRPDLADGEKKELAMLSSYLPEEMNEEEIRVAVKEAISELEASSPADMGKVIKLAIEKTKNRAEGSAVSRIVKEELN